MQGFACEMDHVYLFGKPVFSLEAPLGKTQVLKCKDEQEGSDHTGMGSWGGQTEDK